MPRLARFFPDKIHEERRRDPLLRAEVRFFELLEAQLPAGWTVFYDIGWLGRRSNSGNLRDGQMDFILAHAVNGVLVIELKGGVISFDGTAQQWHSTDSFGVRHNIRNPFQQAKDGKYNLRERLADLLDLRLLDVQLHHAVAFPGTDRPQEPITTEAVPDLIIGRGDLTTLYSRIEEILAFARGSGSFEHGKEIVDGLVRLLARSTNLPNPLRSQIDDEHAEIQTLTNTQIELFRRLQRTRRLSIGGGAGSGKTYVAVQRARDLARQGFETLLVCCSEPLALFLKSLVGQEPRLSVMSASELACRYVPDLDREDPNPDESFPIRLLAAIGDLPRPPFDAILVDEGQDFSSDWFDALEGCVIGGENSIFYVFHDTNNQVIRPNAGKIPSSLLKFDLEENLRNAQTICRSMQRFYSGTVRIAPRGPEGRAVELHQYTSFAELERQLAKVLTGLLMVENLLAREIVVLTPRASVAESALLEMGFPHGIRLVTNPDEVRARSVLLATVADFKGLERPVVLVAELDDKLPTEPSHRAAVFYVAFSRPRSLLSLFATPAVLDEVKVSSH